MSISTLRTEARHAGKSSSRRPRIAYVVSLFPCWSETFIAEEIHRLITLGFEIEIYSIRPPSETQVHTLARNLLARTNYASTWKIAWANINLLCTRPRAYLRQLWRLLQIRQDGLVASLKTLATFLIACSFAREMQRKGIEHVHAHWATFPLSAAWTIGNLIDLPYSFTTHAHDLYEPDCLLAQKAREAEFIITISEYNRAILREIPGVPDKLHVVHCGVDTKKFAAVEPYRWESKRILSVGRLTPIKGFPTLIEACHLLRDRGVDFHCEIVGDGELRFLLQQQIDGYRLGDRVVLSGVANQEAIQSKLAECALFALACEQTEAGQQDGIPVALMEAMSAGIPVVSTRVSGVPELLDEGRCGMLVEPKSPSSLADAIEQLLTRRNLAEQLARAGREKVAEEFDIDSSAEKIGQLFLSNGLLSRVSEEY